MSIKKQIIAIIICLAMLITACIFGNQTQSDLSGVGNKKNATVSTLDDFGEVLKSLNDKRKTTKGVSLAVDREDEKKYVSCNLIETTEIYMSSSSTSNYNDAYYSSSAKSQLTRTLEMAVSENATLYKSDVQAIANSQSEDRTSERTIKRASKSSLDLKIYIYFSDDIVSIYIERLSYACKKTYSNSMDSKNDYNYTEVDDDTGRSFGILKEYCGRWIDCTTDPDFAIELLNVDDKNMDTLSSLGKFIDEQKVANYKGLNESDEIYSMKTDTLLEFFGLTSIKNNDTKIDGECNINLSNPAVPSVDYFYTYNYENKKSDNFSGYNNANQYCYAEDELVFKNINNTVIKSPPKASVDIKDVLERIKKANED